MSADGRAAAAGGEEEEVVNGFLERTTTTWTRAQPSLLKRGIQNLQIYVSNMFQSAKNRSLGLVRQSGKGVLLEERRGTERERKRERVSERDRDEEEEERASCVWDGVFSAWVTNREHSEGVGGIRQAGEIANSRKL
ncbi:hypothetical protein WMY93_026231 [Mugilogobius chulae]|uniref:Uncharacterized protein n=1 Tax=Mugilogobius chulae TaxID=88201 RepID=A0AAW0N8R0_9GOBI